MSKSPTEILAELQEQEPKGILALSLNRFNKRTKKATKLIENADPSNFVKGQHREYSFDLKEPTFVQHIEVHTTGYSKFNSAEFSWKTIRSTESNKEKEKNQDNQFVIQINDILTSFSFKPAKKYLGDPQITKINVFGLTLTELDKSLHDIGKIDNYYSEIIDLCESKILESEEAVSLITTLADKKQELSSSISDLETNKSGIETIISDLQNTRAEIQESINQKTTEEGELQSRLGQIDDTIDSKTKQSQGLNQEIIDRERELKQLKNDINLFPIEIRAFVTQGASNISRYTLLAFLPITVLFYVTWYLFNNAADFAIVYSSADAADIWAVFLARLPFVTVSLAIISASYKLAKIFIAEVMKINSQRLNLSKISIIAKDVSEASEQGLELGEEERYELRTKLKMDLLRSHLKGYIEDDYTYRLDASIYKHSDGTETDNPDDPNKLDDN